MISQGKRYDYIPMWLYIHSNTYTVLTCSSNSIIVMLVAIIFVVYFGILYSIDGMVMFLNVELYSCSVCCLLPLFIYLLIYLPMYTYCIL